MVALMTCAKGEGENVLRLDSFFLCLGDARSSMFAMFATFRDASLYRYCAGNANHPRPLRASSPTKRTIFCIGLSATSICGSYLVQIWAPRMTYLLGKTQQHAIGI